MRSASEQVSYSVPISFSDDYFVVIRRGGRPGAWTWEIQRRSKPIGVRLNGDGFNSEFAAKLAGEKALRELLDGLAQEKMSERWDARVHRARQTARYRRRDD